MTVYLWNSCKKMQRKVLHTLQVCVRLNYISDMSRPVYRVTKIWTTLSSSKNKQTLFISEFILFISTFQFEMLYHKFIFANQISHEYIFQLTIFSVSRLKSRLCLASIAELYLVVGFLTSRKVWAYRRTNNLTYVEGAKTVHTRRYV